MTRRDNWPHFSGNAKQLHITAAFAVGRGTALRAAHLAAVRAPQLWPILKQSPSEKFKFYLNKNYVPKLRAFPSQIEAQKAPQKRATQIPKRSPMAPKQTSLCFLFLLGFAAQHW
jgi:hypothetical protein